MYAVGIVEVAAGVLVAVHARLGALVIAAWLTGILISLVLIPASTTWRCETSAFNWLPSRCGAWPAATTAAPRMASARG